MVPVLGGQHGLTDAEDGEDGEREQEDWVVAAGPWTRMAMLERPGVLQAAIN
jgi:hypothetical protein